MTRPNTNRTCKLVVCQLAISQILHRNYKAPASANFRQLRLTRDFRLLFTLVHFPAAIGPATSLCPVIARFHNGQFYCQHAGTFAILKAVNAHLQRFRSGCYRIIRNTYVILLSQVLHAPFVDFYQKLYSPIVSNPPDEQTRTRRTLPYWLTGGGDQSANDIKQTYISYIANVNATDIKPAHSAHVYL